MSRPTQFRSAGPHALLVEVADADHAASLSLWARESGIEADEIVPAARTVLFDGVASPDAVQERLAAWSPDAGAHAEAETVELPVIYDGADLGTVARIWDCSEVEVVARHTSLEFRSAFCGFAPGFAYLTGLPEELAVPRLETPRERVPAGSVGLAASWCGVYPSASPGGWQLLGRTDAPLWDLTRTEPALLAPGTLVRFRDVS